MTLKSVFIKSLDANLSVNVAKGTYAASYQKFFGLVVDSTRVRPSPPKIQAIAEMPLPTNIMKLRAFLGMTDYLRQQVDKFGIAAARLTNLLHNKAFAFKQGRKLPIEWE